MPETGNRSIVLVEESTRKRAGLGDPTPNPQPLRKYATLGNQEILKRFGEMKQRLEFTVRKAVGKPSAAWSLDGFVVEKQLDRLEKGRQKLPADIDMVERPSRGWSRGSRPPDGREVRLRN